MHDILLPLSKLTRARNSYRHPLQASLAARLPIAGRRVPVRRYWLRQPLPAARRAERYLDRASRARNAATRFVGRGVPADTATADGARAIDRRNVAILVAAASVGALAMYYLDRQQGRRRRALLGDRATHLAHRFRRLPRVVQREGRYARGKLHGLEHDAAELAGMTKHAGVPDDETLVARVRSEAIRHTDLHAGQINVDAYEGCVTLRGQLADEEEIERLLDATKSIDGVREVRSYLHVRGTQAPNKAESYSAVPTNLHAR